MLKKNEWHLQLSLIDLKKFKEAIRTGFSYIEGGNVTFSESVKKRLDQIAPVNKILLRRNNKLHTPNVSIKKSFHEKIET